MIVAADWASFAPLWVTGALAFAAFLFVRRFGGGAALEQLELANTVLERRVSELTTLAEHQAAELAELRAKTDFVLALQPIMTWAESHELAAVKRNETLLKVLELIAGRLGAEPGLA